MKIESENKSGEGVTRRTFVVDGVKVQYEATTSSRRRFLFVKDGLNSEDIVDGKTLRELFSKARLRLAEHQARRFAGLS